MAQKKEDIEEKIEELADLVDTSAKMINEVLLDHGIDTREIAQKTRSAVRRAKPFLMEKRQKLEIYLLNRQLSEVNSKILEELEKMKKSEDSPKSEEE